MESIWTPNESALARFCAHEEEWVDIVPLFGLGERVMLLTGNQIGPWEAGVSTKVPLWIALYLQNKSLGKITVPSNGNWMRVESLKQILAFEKSNERLWQNEPQTKTTEDDDETEISSSSDTPYLPERYWELSQSYSTADNPAAVSVLLKDLWNVRLDKLRRQFQDLYAKNDPLQVVNVTGIGSAELAVMRKVIEQSLSQKAAMLKTPTLPQQTSSSSGPTNSAHSAATVVTPASSVSRPLRARAAIRKFRKELASGAGGT